MNVNRPKPGSKPSPITPEESRAIAKKNADTAEMPLVRYVAMCEQSGVQKISFFATKGGQAITLRGVSEKGRSVAVDVECPTGHPFALYAMQALYEWRDGMGEPVAEEPAAYRFEAQLDDRTHHPAVDEPLAPVTTPPEQTTIPVDVREQRWAASGLDYASIEERAARETEIPPDSVETFGRADFVDGELKNETSVEVKPPAGELVIGVVSGAQLDAMGSKLFEFERRQGEPDAEYRVRILQAKRDHEARLALPTDEAEPEAVESIEVMIHRMAEEGASPSAVSKAVSDHPDFPKPTAPASPTPAMKAAEIAKRSSPVNIHKPPPAGAGQRRPLALPLCKQCKAQPVYNASADVCSAECAKPYYMKKVKPVR